MSGKHSTNTGIILVLLQTVSSFFLIGLPLVFDFESLNVPWVLIIIAPFAIVMISRVIVVYGGSIILFIARVHMPLQWQNILTLGGLRGGIAIALVLSLPTEYELKSLFIALIISVVAINLVVNPILLDRYMKKSKIGASKKREYTWRIIGSQCVPLSLWKATIVSINYQLLNFGDKLDGISLLFFGGFVAR
ncbi:MAG: cation:proton antiporter [Candidatus Nitrosopolaris sp.]